MKNQCFISSLVLIFVFPLFLMGNQSCQNPSPSDEAGQRTLLKRVQMGKIQAPPLITNYNGSSVPFDFSYVATAQSYGVLKKTKSFTTATIDPSQSFNPSGLNQEEQEAFNQCQTQEDGALRGETLEGNLQEDGDLPLPSLLPGQKTIMTKNAACMIDLPQGQVEGSIYDFALMNQVGAQLNLLSGAISIPVGLQFSFKRYELSMGFRIMKPATSDSHPIVSVDRQTYGREYSGGVLMDFGLIQAGPTGYYRTPLRQVVEEALTKGIGQLRDEWAKVEPWYTTVLRNCDRYIYINGGGAGDVGLQVGDILSVYNVTYHFAGPVCQSNLLGAINDEGGPIAYVRVTTIGDNMAAAEIIEHDPLYPHRAERMYPGSRVYIEKLVQPSPTSTSPTPVGGTSGSQGSGSSTDSTDSTNSGTTGPVTDPWGGDR